MPIPDLTNYGSMLGCEMLSNFKALCSLGNLGPTLQWDTVVQGNHSRDSSKGNVGETWGSQGSV